MHPVVKNTKVACDYLLTQGARPGFPSREAYAALEKAGLDAMFWFNCGARCDYALRYRLARHMRGINPAEYLRVAAKVAEIVRA